MSLIYVACRASDNRNKLKEFEIHSSSVALELAVSINDGAVHLLDFCDQVACSELAAFIYVQCFHCSIFWS